jgi:hypothetical protein
MVHVHSSPFPPALQACSLSLVLGGLSSMSRPGLATAEDGEPGAKGLPGGVHGLGAHCHSLPW